MLRQAVQLAQDFGMFRVPTLHANWGEMDADMQRIHATTAWGIFVMNLYGIFRKSARTATHSHQGHVHGTAQGRESRAPSVPALYA